MKKFLSVLLALAVAFTFTFGSTMSAFAVANATSQDYMNAETIGITTAKANLATALTEMNATVPAVEGSANYTIDKDVYASLKSDMEVQLEKEIKAITDPYLNGTSTMAAAAPSAIAASLYGTYASVANLQNWMTHSYAAKAAKAQFAVDYAKIVAPLDKVDMSLYSTTTPVGEKPYADRVTDVLDAVKAEVGEAKVAADATGTVAGYVAAKSAVNATVAAIVTATKFAGTEIDNGLYEINKETASSTYSTTIKTKTEEANAEVNDGAVAATVKAEAQKKYAYYTTNTVAPDKVLADDYLAIYNYLADEKAVVSTTSVAAVSSLNATTLKAKYDAVAGLEAFAAKYKAETDANGNVIRDAAAIDKYVKAAKIDAYLVAVELKATETNTIDAAEQNIKNAVSAATIANLAFTKEAKKAEVEENRAAVIADYYPLEATKVNAAYDKLLTKIDAATADTIAAASTDAAIESIATKGAVDALFTNGTLTTEFNAQLADLNKLVAAKNVGLTVRDSAYVDSTTLSASLVEFYGEKGARTVTEMRALAAEAKALVDALPTLGDIAAAKADAEAKIAAIPTLVTAADKDTVVAAWEANEAYKLISAKDDAVGKSKLAAAVDALYTAMFNELTKKDAVTTDKAGLKALKAEVEEFNALTEAEQIFEDATKYTGSVATKLNAIRTSEAKAVIAAIDAIPLNLTAADKAKVEAARAAYDAFVADWNSTVAGEAFNAPAAITNYNELVAAEAELTEIAPAYDDQDAKADLLDMSRKLTIWRTSKTSIKVTAVGSVKNIKDNGYTVKYSFYKKAPGATSYKLIKTTTSNKYTYTNLKKGTNKFQVKVKVYDADGKLVATKMTYYRAAKVK